MNREPVIRILFILSFICFSISPLYAHEVENHDGQNGVNVFLRLGAMNGEYFSGIGYSLGLFHQSKDTRYTYMYSSYVEQDSIFDSFSDSVFCFDPDDDCGEEDITTELQIISFLYGKKFSSAWVSAGLGYLKGENYTRSSNSEPYDFSTTGLAYSVVWEKPISWLGLDLELSGNFNSENNITEISWRFTF